MKVELSVKTTPTFLLPPESLKEIGPESETCLREVSSARKQDTELPFCSLISLSKLL